MLLLLYLSPARGHADPTRLDPRDGDGHPRETGPNMPLPRGNTVKYDLRHTHKNLNFSLISPTIFGPIYYGPP